MPEIKAELNIPDLWYDFYARLLPGGLFVAAIYILWPGAPSWPTPLQAVILVAAGYVSALVSQPLASPLSHLIHWLVAGGECYYVENIGKKLNPHEVSILDKMHGEVTFFTQCFVLAVVLLIAQIVPRFNLEQELCLTFVAAIGLLVLAAITAYRRKWRADRGLKLTKDEG
jgi:uncharacterized protein involved in cysteine biosynthesis